MDWFMASAIDSPTEETKNIFNNVMKEISTAKQQLHHKNSMKEIPANKITQQLKWDWEYSKRTESLLKLESLHSEKQTCEQLMELASIRSREVSNEIYEIEQEYIEPELVNYIVASFPRRSYEIQGTEYVTYRGKPQLNGKFFTAIGFLIAYAVFF